MQTDSQAKKVALVIGAGDSTGGAIARRFAKEGYLACVTRRSADKIQALVDEIVASGGEARGYASDARKEEDVIQLVEDIERDVGPIEVVVFNIGANVPCSILEETARKYFKIWEMACFGGFLVGREVAKRMVTRERGTILFTGARRVCGSANFAAFAGAKHALRALAQAWRGTRAAQHPCGACGGGRRHRHRFHQDQLPRTLRDERPGRNPQPRPHCRQLLAPAHPAARQLDP